MEKLRANIDKALAKANNSHELPSYIQGLENVETAEPFHEVSTQERLERLVAFRFSQEVRIYINIREKLLEELHSIISDATRDIKSLEEGQKAYLGHVNSDKYNELIKESEATEDSIKSLNGFVEYPDLNQVFKIANFLVAQESRDANSDWLKV